LSRALLTELSLLFVIQKKAHTLHSQNSRAETIKTNFRQLIRAKLILDSDQDDWTPAISTPRWVRVIVGLELGSGRIKDIGGLGAVVKMGAPLSNMYIIVQCLLLKDFLRFF